jgi:hypothetical protein
MKQKTKYQSTLDIITAVAREAEVYYDAKGNKKLVTLPYKTYQRILEHMDDPYDAQAVREARGKKSIPWSKVKKEMQRRRKP